MNPKSNVIKSLQGFIFDLDGTLYLGERALPGAVTTIARLREQGRKVLFVSNKPLYPREVYAAKLTRLGIAATTDDIITSGSILAAHLARTNPNLKLYVVGEENIKNELRERGLQVASEFEDQDAFEVIDPQGIDAVVVAFDRTLDYRKLNTAYQALLNGAAFFATNPDMTCPMPGGGIPDAGATIAALQALTGRKLDLLAGKPSPVMMEVALSQMDCSAEACMIVGDRVETDILMGQQAGMWSGLVLTGATRLDPDKPLSPTPDWIFQDLRELLALL